MSGFYRRLQPETPLRQGDIFHGVPIIAATFDPLYQAIFENPQVRVEPVDLGDMRDGMFLVERVQLTTALLVSQSCDAERAPRLELAPVTPFALEGKTAEKQWKRISHVATSLHETKSYYLPANSTLGLERSIADFGEMFALPRKLLEKLARLGKRVAGLSDGSIAYLQFRLNVMRTRVAQDDYAWPSADDLAIKIAYLDEVIKERNRKIGKMEEAAQSATEAEKLKYEETVHWLREEVVELKQELDRATQARKAADIVEEENAVVSAEAGGSPPSAPSA